MQEKLSQCTQCLHADQMGDTTGMKVGRGIDRLVSSCRMAWTVPFLQITPPLCDPFSYYLQLELIPQFYFSMTIFHAYRYTDVTAFSVFPLPRPAHSMPICNILVREATWAPLNRVPTVI
jgi:hypothetical protein